MALIQFHYYNKFGRKISLGASSEKDVELTKIILLEDSAERDLGPIYYTDKNGQEIKVCYYNALGRDKL
jgi:hypothetical protein